MKTALFCLGGFAASLVLTLVLTPLVRVLNRRLGMVDKPDPRRINKVPVVRGGGLALFVGVIVPTLLFVALSDIPVLPFANANFYRLAVLSLAIVAVGYADDKFGLKPLVKLLLQLAVAFLVWFWVGLGFRDMWPSLPCWADCALTVFWIAGAINAFNLIDGLDGLASGLAFVAVVGMAGVRAFSGLSEGLLLYGTLAGGLLGFLRYNYNPASVFLGDCGSMFIGFAISVLPLCSHAPDSFLVSVGVPLLAMGVPIFDTSLAILRRSIRHFLRKEGVQEGNDEVMTADTDHLHHRILREEGFSQRKAVWILYSMTLFLVGMSFLSVVFSSRMAGIWLLTFTVAIVIAFRDMARIEIFDFSLLLDRMAHSKEETAGVGLSRFATPIYLVVDILLLAGVYLACVFLLDFSMPAKTLRFATIFRVFVTLFFCVLLKAYATVWSRAVVSNFLRLFLACFLGGAVGSVVLSFVASFDILHVLALTVLYVLLSFFFLAFVRLVRPIVRDLLYVLSTNRLINRRDVSRILVYGTGLRYKAFRRELVRSSAVNSRVIVGLLDDNPLLLHNYIGGLQIRGSFKDAPTVVNALNVDTVVVAFKASDDELREIAAALRPLGVRVTVFNFSEEPVQGDDYGTADA